jgi:molybdate transport system substrate-binding protein
MTSTLPPLKGISSKATQQVLAQLSAAYEAQTGQAVHIESVGGVDAAKRVAGGEAFDIVLLASDAINKLVAGGHLVDGSRVDWVKSPVAIAIRSGAPRIDISNEAALRKAVGAARSISYSTGPSGTFLASQFEKWGIAEDVQGKLVIPPPGTPVGSLVSNGQAELGFQQLSELLNVDGIDVLGTLPEDAAYITTFSAGVPVGLDPTHNIAVRGFLDYLISPTTTPVKLQNGMTAVSII